MTVTDLVRQEKNPRRWSLFLDGEFAAGIAEETRVQFALIPQLQLDDVELERILAWDERFNATQSAYRYCSRRRRTKREVEGRLRTQEYPDHAIKAAIEELEEFDIVDDRRFVEAWVHDRHLKKAVGPHLLRSELRARGIDEDMIDSALRTILPEQRERELIERALAGRKIPSSQKQLQNWYQRTARFLAGRGFNNSVVYQILSEHREQLLEAFDHE